MMEIDVSRILRDALFLQKLMGGHKDSKTAISAETSHIFQECCRKLHDSIANLDLKASERALGRLLGNLENPNHSIEFGDFHALGADFLLRLKDELELTKFLTIETAKISFYEQKGPLFGQAVAQHYPTAYQDVGEAGKSLALSRATACVFHLMRTLEVGIRAVARGLGIDDPTKPAERNWGFVLGQIETAIRARSRWRRGERAFYEECYAYLDAVRNPWRNATMHVEKTYTSEEAENLLYAVRFFMQKIASRIDENGKRVPKVSALSKVVSS